MPALEQLVQIAEQLARHRLFGMTSRDAQGGAGRADANAERLLDGADVRIVLAEQIGKQPRVVELEIERVFNS
jgi:transposase